MASASTSAEAGLVCAYYCEVGVRERLVAARHNSTDAAAEGLAALLRTAFEPMVMLRLPESNRPDEMPFTPEVAMFCFPHGVRLLTAEESASNPIPVVTSFVLTASDKSRMYGTCIVWSEVLDPAVVRRYVEEGVGPAEGLAQMAQLPELHAPEAICLLSRAPIFEALTECCRQLFRMRIASPATIEEGALRPLLNTRLPAFARTTSLILGNVRVMVHTPPANELPHTMSGRDFLMLFQRLDAGSVILIWALLLAEHKVVLQAREPHVLTMAAETLSSLLFPFSWQHVYIPILPVRLVDILQAPVPYLIGIDEEVLSLAERSAMITDDVVQVDLDNNEITFDAEVASTMRLPQKQYHKLYKAISPFCRPPSAQNSEHSADHNNSASAFVMAPPPDALSDEAPPTLAEMSDSEVAEASAAVKGAFLRFFVSLMAKYQDFMLLPSAQVKLPSALDFFDAKRWMGRFGGNCTNWLGELLRSQAFTQWLEQRLSPPLSPELEVVFFNEAIDAKLMRHTKTKFFSKQPTPLLTTGVMPASGYSGALVPEDVKTVYNASMIAARPIKSQQQVALLLIFASGLHETEPGEVVEFQRRLKQEFAANLLWSRVDVGAALLLHVCRWRSAGSEQQQLFADAGLENMPVRKAMLDLSLYAEGAYKAQLHESVRQCLRTMAQVGGSSMPLCVVSHGFGSVIAVDFFTQLQQQQSLNGAAGGGAAGGAAAAEAPTPVEQGLTLCYLCTLGSPLPLRLSGGEAAGAAPLQVPTPYVLQRWPQLRGGWANLYHKADVMGYPLQAARKGVTHETPSAARVRKDQPIQHAYLSEAFVRPVCQALSRVWQDVNLTLKERSEREGPNS